MPDPIPWTTIDPATVANDADEYVTKKGADYARVTRRQIFTDAIARTSGAGPILQWLNAVDAVMAQLGADGILTTPGLLEHPTLGFVLKNAGGGAVFELQFGQPTFVVAAVFTGSLTLNSEVRRDSYDPLDLVNIGARASAAGKVPAYFRGAAGQTADLSQWQTSAGAVLAAIGAEGAFRPVSLADVAAPVNSVYYSADAAALVYKDAGGTVHPLY